MGIGVSAFAAALAWEASYLVFLARFRRGDADVERMLWCDADVPEIDVDGLLGARVRQAERWLALAAREQKRRATLAARRRRR